MLDYFKKRKQMDEVTKDLLMLYMDVSNYNTLYPDSTEHISKLEAELEELKSGLEL